MTMTLAQLRDALKGVWVPTHWGTDGRSYKMSDLIESLDHYISQHQPVAQGEAVDARKLAVGRYTSGEEQRAFVDGYAAATPTTPTGHKVVPVAPTETMLRNGWECMPDSNAYLKGGMDFVYYIYKAMLAAAPDAGGV